MTGEPGAGVSPSFKLSTPQKRLFFVIFSFGGLQFLLGLLLAVVFSNPGSDFQYALGGIGQWCVLVGFGIALAGALGSFLYDFTIRPLQRLSERLGEWIRAGQ